MSVSGTHLICPQCGDSESVEEIQAKIDGSLRDKALTLSGVSVVILLTSHVCFAFVGKVLPIPEIVWAIVLTPWLGASTGKVVEVIDKAVNKGGKA